MRKDKHCFFVFISANFANEVSSFAVYCEMFLKWSKTLMCITDPRVAAHLKIQPIFLYKSFFVSNHQSVRSMEEFRNLDRDIEGSAKRWKKFVESECPEKEKFPQEWKNKTSLQRLCMMRALRPDRMTYAVR